MRYACLRVPTKPVQIHRAVAMRNTELSIRGLSRGRREPVARPPCRRAPRGRLGIWLEIFRWPDPVLADGRNRDRDSCKLRPDGARAALAAVRHGLRGVD